MNVEGTEMIMCRGDGGTTRALSLLDYLSTRQLSPTAYPNGYRILVLATTLVHGKRMLQAIREWSRCTTGSAHIDSKTLRCVKDTADSLWLTRDHHQPLVDIPLWKLIKIECCAASAQALKARSADLLVVNPALFAPATVLVAEEQSPANARTC